MSEGGGAPSCEEGGVGGVMVVVWKGGVGNSWTGLLELLMAFG